MAKSKKTKAVAKKKVVSKPKAKFDLAVTFNQEIFRSQGVSACDAFHNMKIPPRIIKTQIMLYLKEGKKKMEQVIMGVQLRRMMNNKTSQDIWAKRCEQKLA